MSRTATAHPPAFDPELPVLESKLQPCQHLPWAVPRTALVNRLRASRAPIVALIAPAGFGKTMLLAQWADRDARPHAWLSVDEQDCDPAVFVRYVAAALDRAVDVEPLLLEPLAAPDARSWPSTLAQLAAALSSACTPMIFVLDGVDVLTSRRTVQAVSVLADHLPEGSTLALSCRSEPPLPIARFRAAGRLFELHPNDLAMSNHRARELLRYAGVDHPPEQVADLMRRTEGWPAGLYLAALALEAAGSAGEDDGAAHCLHDRFMDEYVRHEVLSTLGEAELSFATRISFLETFSWPLCAAVDPSNQVDALREPGLRGLLVALDHPRGWYRFHRPFRDVLRSELDRREPAVIQELNSRAAAWYEAHGMLEEAVDHARAAGEIENMARLVSSTWFAAVDRGQLPRVARWLESLDQEAVLERFPMLAIAGAWVNALSGREPEAARWLESAGGRAGRGRWASDGSMEAVVALLRAAVCRDGVAVMCADAELALDRLGPRSPYRPAALLVLGIAQLLAGAEHEADAILAEVAEQSSLTGGAVPASLALAERVVLAIGRGNPAEAGALARQARLSVLEGGTGAYATSSLVYAVVAHADLRHGNPASARSELARATELLARPGHTFPWLEAQAWLEIVRLNLALADDAGAEAALGNLDVLLRRCPDLGPLADGARELRHQLAVRQAGDGHRPARLTDAELRLLPLLATHLSFLEIAERLFVSRNTVKTQAISVYRKLGVSSRSEAIARVADLGLIDVPVMPARTG